ncbi:TrmH family RNA methyltransferase [Rarobacter incanus]|uniref:SpoU rRNA methylase family protein n=1 Tax=Rarobacter incanus TaxID=153494 RepID=A0A542SQE6_9MICO|nr:TrmH family RNA methyltransferase [Rarobacter incanus]TQK76836.1 SpoU rRNA methylase family protein [Rarobacter incanus]
MLENRPSPGAPLTAKSASGTRLQGAPTPTGAARGDARAKFDPELIAGGDTRNVVDEFRLWTVDAIRDELDARAAAALAAGQGQLQIAIENWGHDFNIGSVVRTANAMGVRHVHIVGRRRWNKRGAMVTDRYLHVHHHESIASLVGWARDFDLEVIGIDNVPGSEAMEGWAPPRSALMVFGEESQGLSDEARLAATTIRHITQFGSTRSINAGAAAAVAMYHWRQFRATGS